jgi:dolichyl-phosphate beta-glucosyltransferase
MSENKPQYSVSIVLPAFNESHRLPQTLTSIRPYLDSRFEQYQVLVVDDGSTDSTAEIVRSAAGAWPNLSLLQQPRNMGKGAAVRRGCLEASCDLVCFMDADLATPIEELDLMIRHFNDGKVQAVVGVRTYQEHESKWRRIVGLSLQILAHLIVFEKAVIDSQCGFKCFTRKAARALFSLSRVDGGMFDVELFYLMHRIGIPVYYQPVHWDNKEGSRINFVKCMFLDPVDLIAIRMRGVMGKYRRTADVDAVASPPKEFRKRAGAP